MASNTNYNCSLISVKVSATLRDCLRRLLMRFRRAHVFILARNSRGRGEITSLCLCSTFISFHPWRRSSIPFFFFPFINFSKITTELLLLLFELGGWKLPPRKTREEKQELLPTNEAFSPSFSVGLCFPSSIFKAPITFPSFC